MAYENENMKSVIGFKGKTNRYLLFIVLIIFGIYQYAIGKICGFTMVPDEFGYWASAAKNVGYDWSEVASLGSYYSFGYSLILTPVLWLFRDGVMAYRAAVAVNMLLMCGGFFLILGMIRRLFPETDQTKQVFIGGIAVLYPVWIFNIQMTMAEALLMFLFVLVTYLFVCLMQKARVVTAVFLAVSLAYIYCVHMRSIGVLLACMITLVFWSVTEHPGAKTVLAFVGVLLLLGVLAAVLKQNTIVQVFSDADRQLLAGNDYGGQQGKFQQIFSFHGMIRLIKAVIGKVFYLGLASFGVFYWGMCWAIKNSVLLLKKIIKKEKAKTEELVSMFLLLAMFGEILINSIYGYGSNVIDALIYGRYDEFLMPVFLMAGVIVMCRSRWVFRGTILAGICTGLMVPVLLNIIEAEKMTGLRGYMVAGISYLLKEEDLDIYQFFRNTWVLGFGVMLLTALLIWLSGKSKNLVWLLAGIIVIEIAAGLQISSHYTYRVNRSNFMDLMIAEEIFEHAEAEDCVMYLEEGNHEYIDFLQMQLGQRAIKVIREDQLDDLMIKDLDGKIGGVFLITHIDTGYKEQLGKLFDKCVRANTFYLYYNGKDAAWDEADHTDPLL